MSWEESQRKEQVYRKAKVDREVVLKLIESENGETDLIFSLRNNKMITEIKLTLEEWNAIISFLNKTSDRIVTEINKLSGKPTSTPVATPVATIATESPSKLTENAIAEHVTLPESEKNQDTEIIAEPVATPQS